MTTLSSRLRPLMEDSLICMLSASIAASLYGTPRPRSRHNLPPRDLPLRDAGVGRAEGLEPPRLASQEPKSCASASSATPAGFATPNSAALLLCGELHASA